MATSLTCFLYFLHLPPCRHSKQLAITRLDFAKALLDPIGDAELFAPYNGGAKSFTLN
mgnify:CR=1 FL=1